MPPKVEEQGNKYGSLTVLHENGVTPAGKVVWLCLCTCGKTVPAVGSDLRNGRYHTCGCGRVKHGLRDHPLYGTWRNMITRCHNPNSDSYPPYGGRGIKVCQVWRDSFISFITWCEENGQRAELQLDRKDNDGDYTPENCRFVPPFINANNKTRLRIDNTTGYRGVHLRGQKFVAQIQHILHRGGKKTYIGTFNTLQEAVQARDRYIIKHHLPHRRSNL